MPPASHPGRRRPDRHPRPAGDEPARRRLRGERGRPTAPAALASQDERASDLLILDLMMPGLDGLEVCKALRARGRSDADPDADREVDRARPRARPRARRRRLPDQAVLAGRAAGARQGAAAPRRPAARGAGRRGGASRARCATASSRSCRPSARCAFAARRSTSPRSSSTCCCTSPRTRATCSRARQLLDAVWGYTPRRLRAHGDDAHQPPARQARGRPDAPGADPHRARRRLQDARCAAMTAAPRAPAHDASASSSR